ncbi:MAG: hypothetical protein ACE5O2_08355 [Armatimonadota bacterium]
MTGEATHADEGWTVAGVQVVGIETMPGIGRDSSRPYGQKDAKLDGRHAEMKRLARRALAAVAVSVVGCGATFAQPEAPAPAEREVIMGVKMTEPMTVLESRFTAAPADAGQAMTPIAEGIFAAAAEARINILPNRATVVVITPMQEMMQGAPEELDWAFRMPTIDALEPGELHGHPDIKVVRTEPRLVGYTYAKGPPDVVVQPRMMSLTMWVVGQGYSPVGPMFMTTFQDPGQTDQEDIVTELQVGIKRPEEGEAPVEGGQ